MQFLMCTSDENHLYRLKAYIKKLKIFPLKVTLIGLIAYAMIIKNLGMKLRRINVIAKSLPILPILKGITEIFGNLERHDIL